MRGIWSWVAVAVALTPAPLSRAMGICGPLILTGVGTPDPAGKHYAAEVLGGTTGARRIIIEGWHDRLRLPLQTAVRLEVEVLEWDGKRHAPVRVRLRKELGVVKRRAELAQTWEWLEGTDRKRCP